MLSGQGCRTLEGAVIQNSATNMADTFSNKCRILIRKELQLTYYENSKLFKSGYM
jgi:hypothetical protein